ncbi:hypothetical protein Prum_099990 [Phytohabitans rumicis]|uniref:Uncharacterized protein n=1 Tax=Phytohabitans rumicis TaxID=1076125 RepID=A0A6V8LQG8_9ACTN|nr:hypothetical protein Prum_099990 [Phytohabitans rumicis]
MDGDHRGGRADDVHPVVPGGRRPGADPDDPRPGPAGHRHPNPGYSVDTVQNEPGNLAVQFTEPNHYFIIHAVWHNGPFAEVSEVGS